MTILIVTLCDMLLTQMQIEANMAVQTEEDQEVHCIFVHIQHMP